MTDEGMKAYDFQAAGDVQKDDEELARYLRTRARELCKRYESGDAAG